MTALLSIDPSGDPNGHTGVVLLGYDGVRPAYEIASWAIPGGVKAFRNWYNETVDEDGDIPYGDGAHWFFGDTGIVVCEKFVPRGVPGADYTPLVMEGAIEWVFPDVIFDPASGYKTAVPDEVLKRLGLWWTGDHHADRVSAARHGVRYLKNQLHKPTLEAGWTRA